MDALIEKFRKKIALVSLDFSRSLMDRIDWNARLIGIKGARGVGKTTLLLQYIKKNFKIDESVLYVSLDDIWFSDNRLVDLADDFVKKGGKHLFLDEVHKYPDWSREIKNIYDDFPEIHVVFTGSSLLEILNARADLSRRSLIYRLQGLSFREYLNFINHLDFPVYGLHEIIEGHEDISGKILSRTKPLKYFANYIKEGYYPFFYEDLPSYHNRIQEVVNLIIDIELPLLRNVEVAFTRKIKQLLLIISESAPFIPNISKLSEKIGINRNTLVSYMQYLQEADLIAPLYKNSYGISRMQKPDKIFLENTNIAYAINPFTPDSGNLRETFFLNQLKYQHQISYPFSGDFLIDDEYLIEVGGKNKSAKQLSDWPENKAIVAADGIEFGHSGKIPLWLFGFLY
ncbi:MAG: AAA family ATPase [Kosmotogaceae bacterium]